MTWLYIDQMWYCKLDGVKYTATFYTTILETKWRVRNGCQTLVRNLVISESLWYIQKVWTRDHKHLLLMNTHHLKS